MFFGLNLQTDNNIH